MRISEIMHTDTSFAHQNNEGKERFSSMVRWFRQNRFSTSHQLQRKVNVRSKKIKIIDEKSFVCKSRSSNSTNQIIEQQRSTIDKFNKSQMDFTFDFVLLF